MLGVTGPIQGQLHFELALRPLLMYSLRWDCIQIGTYVPWCNYVVTLAENNQQIVTEPTTGTERTVIVNSWYFGTLFNLQFLWIEEGPCFMKILTKQSNSC